MINIDADYIASVSNLGPVNSSITKGLEEIVSWLSKINLVNVEGIEPLYRMPNDHYCREGDKSSKVCTTEEILSNTPHKNNNFILVPKVRGGETDF